jgi:hypothetical protein
MAFPGNLDLSYIAPTKTFRHVLKAGDTAIHVYAPEPVVLILAHAPDGGDLHEAIVAASSNATIKGIDKAASLVPVVARRVVVGWENVNDESGQPVPFVPDDCEKLLRLIIDRGRASDGFWPIVARCRDADNFCGRPTGKVVGDLGNG